jgi:CubicO group peptidase (beta-lactamase class C family)
MIMRQQTAAGMTRRLALPATALGVLAPRLLLAQPASSVNDANIKKAVAELDGLVSRAMASTGVPGLAVAVVCRDAVAFQKGFGVRQIGHPEPVDTDTVFALASVSKPIASTVVAALVGDGRVAWDDPIVRHYPEFAMNDPWLTSQVTLRDMFAHRSGLPDHAGDDLEDMGYDRDQVLHRLRWQKPGYPFRAGYAYTNFGLTAAAVAAARAAGKSWEAVSAERLYKPLGMSRTSSSFADFMAQPNRAVEHARIDGAWVARYTRQPDAQSPAGGVSSSVSDLCAWMRLQLARGTLGGVRIVDGAALDETHRPQVVRPPAPQDPGAKGPGFYGLGWNVDLGADGGIQFSHSGAFSMGAATCVTLLPAAGLGIVTLSNTSPIGLPEAINRSFLDLALQGAVQRDWVALFGQLMAQAMTPNYGRPDGYAKAPATTTAAAPLAAYVGAYANDLYGPIEVANVGGGLVLKQGPRLEAAPLRHFDRDVFTYQPTGENAYGPASVAFMLDPYGKAASVRIENLDINHQGLFTRAAA